MHSVRQWRTVAPVGMSAYIGWLRAAVGHDLLLVPSVSVLPVDARGRVLLVRHAGHDDGWAVLGGAVELGESPAQTAIREAREEIGSEVRLLGLIDVLGGPEYEVTYPNGDRTAYGTQFTETNGELRPGPTRIRTGWMNAAQKPASNRSLTTKPGCAPFHSRQLRSLAQVMSGRPRYVRRALLLHWSRGLRGGADAGAVSGHEESHRPVLCPVQSLGASL